MKTQGLYFFPPQITLQPLTTMQPIKPSVGSINLGLSHNSWNISYPMNGLPRDFNIIHQGLSKHKTTLYQVKPYTLAHTPCKW